MILTGDCLEILPTLKAESVQCCVTSPPYYGLRDYGVDGQIGLESTPEAYVEKLVSVFSEVRRVLRDDGTAWLNLGDSYARDGGAVTAPGATAKAGNTLANIDTREAARAGTIGLKPKDLIGIPWLVAKALQAPYYTGRVKSERDRIYLAATIDAEGTICGFTHKRKDNGDIRRGIHLTVTNSNIRMLDECYRIWQTSKQEHNAHGKGHLGKLDTFRWIAHDLSEKQQLLAELYPYFICKQKQALLAWNFLEISKQARGRNKGAEGDENRDKSAWVVHALSRLNHLEPVDIPSWVQEPPSQYEPGWFLRQDCIWSKPNPMPESVTDRCTKAHEYIFLLTKSARYFYDSEAVKEPAKIRDDSRPFGIRDSGEHGQSGRVYQAHGKWSTEDPQSSGKRITDRVAEARANGADHDSPFGAFRNRRSVWTITTKPFREAHFATFPPEIPEICIKAGSGPGDTILDPFSGAGTTGLVAEKLGRKYIGIELNQEYVKMSEDRIESELGGLF